MIITYHWDRNMQFHCNTSYTGLFDGTAEDISTNGYNSHIKSINKNNK